MIKTIKYLALTAFAVLNLAQNVDASEYYWERGEETGSEYFWERGEEAGSEYFWERGEGPGSEYYWHRGEGPGSEYYWRRGEGPGSEYYWRRGGQATDFSLILILIKAGALNLPIDIVLD